MGCTILRPALWPRSTDGLYNKLFTLRLTGDYNDHYNLEESDVLPLFEPTERIIKEISALTKDILNKLDFQEEKTPAV